MAKDKDENIKKVVRFFLSNPDVRVKEITELLQTTKRQTLRYLEEFRGTQLRESEDRMGAFVYVPSEEEIEMSVLTLKRAIEKGLISDDMIDVAQKVMQQASRSA